MSEEAKVAAAAEPSATAATAPTEATGAAKVEAPGAAPTDAPKAAPTDAPKESLAADAAAKTSSFWRDNVAARVNAHGGGLKGMGGAAKQNIGEIGKGLNVFSESSKGYRGAAFMRVGAIGAGSAIALGGFKAKDAQGNDRGFVSRSGQVLLGTGLIAGGVLAGKAGGALAAR